jgi:hypothetical protein
VTILFPSARHGLSPRLGAVASLVALLCATAAQPASAQEERMYFPAVDNVTQVLVEKINAETVRIDMSAWYLTEGLIVNALLARHQAGVPIRLIGDRGSIFEIDVHTKNAFYRLANAGVPIRLRFHPTWYPEIAHWKATIFAGQNLVTFGSANYTPFELAPASATNYKDETVLFTDDAALVGAFKTKFDQMWNDTTVETHSRIAGPPYFLNWHDACARESACSDFSTQYPTPAAMIIDTARLEPDNPLPPEMVWGQGPLFNNRLVQEIKKESTRIDFAIYRLTVDNITDALLAKHNAGVPIRIIMEPNEYRNRKWPEFWLTHANMDKLWAAGVPIKQRLHTGLTHMKMLVTSTVATNASSNLAAAWQRDHNYFVPALSKPAIYGAMRDRFDFMWNDPTGFEDFVPEPPDAPVLSSPANQASNVTTTPTLVWNRAAFAVSYDVYLGTSPGALAKVATVPARLINDPPLTYSWKAPAPLQEGTTYYWRVVSRTNASDVNPALVASSTGRSFTTTGAVATLPAAPSNPNPSNGASSVGTSPTLTWASQPAGTTYNVAFGTSNPPSPAVSGLTSSSYSPGSLAPSTTYYWRVTAVNGAGSTVGPVWSFTTGGAAPPVDEIVIYASDVTARVGAWAFANDGTAAAGVLLRSPDNGYANTGNALASPPHYFEATFDALANTRYRIWVRMRAIDNSKWNDSVFVQFSDSVNSSGNPIYRIGTTSSITENLWTCGSCQTFGWGWSRHAYWLGDTGDVWFQNNGTHTIRIQTREDGVEIDQIVISPATYLTAAPGPVSNDTTIVAKPSAPVPQAPGMPSSPNPANGAETSTALTLRWNSTGATSYDVYFGSGASPSLVAANHTANSFAVSNLNEGQTYQWRIVARNANGETGGPTWSFVTAVAPEEPQEPAEIVIYASDIPTTALNGGWTKTNDATAAAGVRLSTPNNGFAAANSPLANPTHFVNVTFEALANVPYRIWLRLKALNNDKFNDAVWVQFSDARVNGQPVYPLNSTSGLLVNLATDAGAGSLNGWGWQNGAYWLNQATTVTFANSGTHTMRIQLREDGVMLDQIVLSPGMHLQRAPGSVTNDSTIVPKP